MRKTNENQEYAKQLMRKHPWPGRAWAMLWGATEPFIVQRLRRGLFDGWETQYPEDADPQNLPYPLIFGTIEEAKQALAEEYARTREHAVYRIAGYHTGAEFGQVRF